MSNGVTTMTASSCSTLSQAIPAGFAARLETIAERARQDERDRIARDLHDDVIHQLAFLAIDLDQLRQQTDACQPTTVGQRLVAALAQLKAIGSTVRNVAHALKPSSVSDLGPAVRDLCREVNSRYDLDVHFSYVPEAPAVRGALALALFRIAQEALRNVVTHSGARHVTVEIAGRLDTLHLTIADDGRGFDRKASDAGGIGLANMRERLDPFNGRLSIRSEPLKGTRIEVSVPRHLDEVDDAAPEADDRRVRPIACPEL
jgi:signal transduction histidine kinase